MSTTAVIRRTLGLGEHLLTGALLTVLFGRNPRGDTPGRRHASLIRWWHERLCRTLDIEVRVDGEPVTDAALLVANHVSWMDIPVLGSLAQTSFLSKEEIRRWPLIGWLATTSGTVFIRRGGHQAAAVNDVIARRVRTGGTLILFPEGTTTDGRSVRPFYPRLLAAAVDGGLAVQPVAIRYFNRHGEIDDLAPFVGTESFPHHLSRLLRHRGLGVQVTFCPPLSPPHASRRALAEAACHVIREALPGTPGARDKQEPVLPFPAGQEA